MDNEIDNVLHFCFALAFGKMLFVFGKILGCFLHLCAAK